MNRGFQAALDRLERRRRFDTCRRAESRLHGPDQQGRRGRGPALRHGFPACLVGARGQGGGLRRRCCRSPRSRPRRHKAARQGRGGGQDDRRRPAARRRGREGGRRRRERGRRVQEPRPGPRRKGPKSTVPITARRGRASYLGARAEGHQDPGATSTYMLLDAAARALEGSS